MEMEHFIRLFSCFPFYKTLILGRKMERKEKELKPFAFSFSLLLERGKFS